MTSAKLSDDAKLYIVQRLAMFDTPSQIADGVREEFGVVVTRQSIEHYDPAKRPQIAQRWASLHAATRTAFLEETAKEPAAHRAVRVRRLARMAERAELKGNIPLAKELLKQIAEEVGDAYTNTRKLTHAGSLAGGVLAVPVPVTDAQWTGAALAQQTALAQRPPSVAQGAGT